MATIGIETAQNVVVQHEVASVGDRIVAAILDSLVLLAWIFALVFIFFIVGSIGKDVGFLGVGFFLFLFLAGIPYLFYHLFCEVTMDGQSIGKRARKIKVARIDGGQPRVGQYLMRWVLRPIDSFYYLGLIVILINGKGQRLGDLAAGTCVITLKQRLKLKDTLMTEVGPQHVVQFPEALRLNDAQAAMIKELLNNQTLGTRYELARDMAERVSVAIGNNGAGMKPEEFLRAVLKDYVYLSGQTGQPTSR